MIRHIRHNDIDKAWWDATLLRCANRLWYAQSWVLDHCSPEWDALIDEDAHAIMPLTWRRKWGVEYLYQPFGLQQLGVFATNPSTSQVGAFLESVPDRFSYWDFSIQGHEALPALPDMIITERTNQVMRVHENLGALRATYAQGHRRNLRAGNVEFRYSSISTHEFFRLYESTTGARFGGSETKGLSGLERAVQEGAERGQCDILSFMVNDQVTGAALFVNWAGRSILLKSANRPEGKEARAMFRLVDHWIALNAGTGALLDFAGSMDPGTARFNAGFGATPAPYFRVVRNRLPRPLRWIKS